MVIDKNKRYLMLVESPNKIKTVSTILKDLGYSNIVVKASVGHITSINDSGLYNMGIDPQNNFKIDFKISDDKRDIVFKLKEEVKLSNFVILATDGDREGEAIAWSLKKFLNIPDTKYVRITYHEITKPAIQKALNNATTINDELVEAAHTRSCLDKIVGYRLSPLARQELRARSVGRCQSAGLKLVVDREKEIINFKPETYYELFLNFKKNNIDFKAKYIGDDKKDISKFNTRDECEQVGKDCYKKPYSISNIETKDVNQNAPAPFITSTFQQEISAKLGISVKDSMSYAQKLFEGIDINGKHVALITYIRTDSPTISSEFEKSAKLYIKQNYGDIYQGAKKVKASALAQEGHECIRPVDITMTPAKLQNYVKDNKSIKIYSMIWKRTVESLCKPAVIENKIITIKNGVHRFQMVFKHIKDKGYKIIEE